MARKDLAKRLLISPGSAVVLGLALNGLLWLLTLTLFPHGDPAAVLHYRVGIGVDFIGEGRQITRLPLLGLVITIGNGLLAAAVYRHERVTAWLLSGMLPVIQLILIGSFVLIWQAN